MRLRLVAVSFDAHDPARLAAFGAGGPANIFLAGCGFLGEVSCDGTREVGLFWRDALGWPLVWDQDEETAAQSPRGGTKVSWGGSPVALRMEEPAALRPLVAPASPRKWSDWSRSVRPSSATGTATSSLPTSTATNSWSAPG